MATGPIQGNGRQLLGYAERVKLGMPRLAEIIPLATTRFGWDTLLLGK